MTACAFYDVQAALVLSANVVFEEDTRPLWGCEPVCINCNMRNPCCPLHCGVMHVPLPMHLQPWFETHPACYIYCHLTAA